MAKYVAVLLDGKLTIHLPHTSGNYYTLCGLDGMDSLVGQEITDVPKGSKVDCIECRSIWNVCKTFTSKDFAAPNKA